MCSKSSANSSYFLREVNICFSEFLDFQKIRFVKVVGLKWYQQTNIIQLFWNSPKPFLSISAKTIDRHKISGKYEHCQRQWQRQQLSTLAFPVNVRNKSASSGRKAPGGRTKNENVAFKTKLERNGKVKKQFRLLVCQFWLQLFFSSKFECNFSNAQLVWWQLWVFCRKPTFSAGRIWNIGNSINNILSSLKIILIHENDNLFHSYQCRDLVHLWIAKKNTVDT